MPEILEVEAAREVLGAHALDREIARVHAPDTWFLKRGTTGAALRHALIGNSFTAARRIGKQIVLDTKDPDVRLGVHLGMSGRVIVDGEEAGDPLVYASNREVAKWHRFGVHFVDGGSFMLRDPRRLGAVELDPDESRLGPDALHADRSSSSTTRSAKRTAPIKAVLMDQARDRRARQPARGRDAVAGGHRSVAARGGDRRRRAPRCCTRRSAPRCGCSAGGAARTPATCRVT